MTIWSAFQGGIPNTRGAWLAALFVAIAFSLILSVLFFGQPEHPRNGFPVLTGRTVDQALLLSPMTRETVDAALTDFEAQTGQQFVVATVNSLSGLSIEEYGVQLGRLWGIGSKGKNDGVLLIVAPNEHKVRIEVGYGLEYILTDAQCHHIIEKFILPEFRNKRFEQGIVLGVQEIIKVFNGNTRMITPSAVPDDAHNKGQNKNTIVGIAFLVGMLVIWCVGNAYEAIRRKLGKKDDKDDDDDNNSSGGYFGGFGGGSGGGGFSGGGGSFGGGGSSGSW